MRRGTVPNLFACLESPLRNVLGRAATIEPAAQVQGLGIIESTPYEIVGTTAVINLDGVLQKYADFFTMLGFGTSMAFVVDQIQRAVADDDVESILLRVDSPGGTVAGTSDLAEAVAAAAKVKTLYAYAEDCCASAAYWVGSQASKLYCNSTAMVGSIGTYMLIEDFSKLANTAGITVHVIRAGEFKGSGAVGTEITSEQLAEFQRTVDELNAHFLEGVATGRKLSRERVKELADGRVHIGAAAKSLGLVDGVRSFAQALEELQATKPRTPKPSSTLSGSGYPAAVVSSFPTAAGPAPEEIARRQEREDLGKFNQVEWHVTERMSRGYSRAEALDECRANENWNYVGWQRYRESVGIVATAPAADPEPSKESVVAQFKQALRKRVARGETRAQAVRSISRENKSLYQQYRQHTGA
jgi:signal peptide peptidase SppA